MILMLLLGGMALMYLAGYDRGRWVEGRRHGDAWTYPRDPKEGDAP